MTGIPDPRLALAALLFCATLALMFVPGASAPIEEVHPVAPPIDTSRIDLRGDGMSHDSVSLTVVAAARLLGRDADYETVFCQSGTAFAPSIDPGEDCTSHWHVCAWHATAGLPQVARRLGLKVEPLGMPTFADHNALPEAVAQHRRRCAGIIRSAMDRGRIVLTSGGWNIGLDPRGPHGFVHWGYMGIVTEADPTTGRILGAHLNGFSDNLIDAPGAFWTVIRDDEPIAAGQADLSMLRLAVDRIRGKGVFARADRVVNGLEAMDAWIRQMRVVRGFCASCFAQKGANIGDAPNNARRMSAGAQAAARQLRRIGNAEGVPANARRLLESAASRYDRIAALLKPALTGEGGLRYAEFIGDMDRQKAHTDSVLAPIRVELAGVAVDLEKARIAMTLRHEEGKTWIDVPGFDPGQYASSVHGADARILQTLGEALTYEDLICYGGFAFRVGVHEAFCPSAGHPCCGYRCIEGSNRALPLQTSFFNAFPEGKERPDRAPFEADVRAAIRASIDRGVPVHYGSEEDGLIVGYSGEGKRWLCMHPYHKGGRETFWYDEGKGFAGGEKWPWGIAVWTDPKPEDQRPSDRELTVAALRQAVDTWKTEKREAYFCGEAAYAHWLNWLRDVESGKARDPKAGMQGNGWCFDVLVHSRRIAGPWLKAKAELFTGETRELLSVAGDHYTQMATVCMEGLNCPWDLAPGPDKLDRWTSEMRQTQIRKLEAAREHDRAAIAAIEKALATEGMAP